MSSRVPDPGASINEKYCDGVVGGREERREYDH